MPLAVSAARGCIYRQLDGRDVGGMRLCSVLPAAGSHQACCGCTLSTLPLECHSVLKSFEQGCQGILAWQARQLSICLTLLSNIQPVCHLVLLQVCGPRRPQRHLPHTTGCRQPTPQLPAKVCSKLWQGRKVRTHVRCIAHKVWWGYCGCSESAAHQLTAVYTGLARGGAARLAAGHHRPQQLLPGGLRLPCIPGAMFVPLGLSWLWCRRRALSAAVSVTCG
jgi:hypothetical protein